jgi:hypothetical protein
MPGRAESPVALGAEKIKRLKREVALHYIHFFMHSCVFIPIPHHFAPTWQNSMLHFWQAMLSGPSSHDAGVKSNRESMVRGKLLFQSRRAHG